MVPIAAARAGGSACRAITSCACGGVDLHMRRRGCMCAGVLSGRASFRWSDARTRSQDSSRGLSRHPSAGTPSATPAQTSIA
eukprot:10176336-Alexandrium_andersonii.AAC.1